MNEILATYAMEIIKVIALMIFTIIGVSAAKLQAKYINTETKRKVAATTVAYIEQVYSANYMRGTSGDTFQPLD